MLRSDEVVLNVSPLNDMVFFKILLPYLRSMVTSNSFALVKTMEMSGPI
jgi:hypothetical protein